MQKRTTEQQPHGPLVIVGSSKIAAREIVRDDLRLPDRNVIGLDPEYALGYYRPEILADHSQVVATDKAITLAHHLHEMLMRVTVNHFEGLQDVIQLASVEKTLAGALVSNLFGSLEKASHVTTVLDNLLARSMVVLTSDVVFGLEDSNGEVKYYHKPARDGEWNEEQKAQIVERHNKAAYAVWQPSWTVAALLGSLNPVYNSFSGLTIKAPIVPFTNVEQAEHYLQPNVSGGLTLVERSQDKGVTFQVTQLTTDNRQRRLPFSYDHVTRTVAQKVPATSRRTRSLITQAMSSIREQAS